MSTESFTKQITIKPNDKQLLELLGVNAMTIEELRNNKPVWATHYLKHPDEGYSKYIKETSTHFVFFQYGKKWSFTKSHMRNLGEVIEL